MSASEGLPFDLRALSVFLAVCDAGGMAAAARRIGLTQPAVSLAVAELEQRFGAALFDRSVRPLALTSAGALLRQRASALLSEARQIAPMMREIERGMLPLLRIGLIDSLARSLSTPLARTAAGLADEVAILAGLTASHAGALLTRNLDLMIGLDDLADVPGLERWPVLTEAYVLALPRGAPAISSIADLATLGEASQFVRFTARSSTGVEIERHLRRLGLEFPRRLEFDTPHGVAALVADGGGFAITTPLCLIESGVEPADVLFAPLPGPAFTRRVTLVARRGQHGRAPRLLAEAARGELKAQIPERLERLSPLLARSVEIAPGHERETQSP